MTRGRALVLIAAVSVLFHLKGITAPLKDYHFHRQINTAMIARNYHENGLHFFSPQVDFDGPYTGRTATEFPLYMWLMGLLWPLAGLGALWGRFMSTAFSALGAVYLYLFLERRLSPREALASALLFCVIPIEVYFGRTVQPEALALAGTLGAFYHFDRYLDDESAGQWTVAVLWAMLSIGEKLPYGYALLPLAALAWARRGWPVFKKPLVLAAAPVALAFVFAWYKYAATGPYVVPDHLSEFEGLLTYKWFYVQFQFISRLPELCATWAGMALAVPGAWLLWKRGGPERRFFHIWWVSVAIYIVLGGAYCFYHEYTSLPWAPIMAAFAGVGLVAAWDGAASVSRPQAARAGLAALLVSLLVMGYYRIAHWYNQNFAYLANAEAAAAQVSGRDDLFLCNQRASSVDLYYLRRRGWSTGLVEQEGPQSIPWIEAHVKLGARFFESEKAALNPDHAKWLAAQGSKVYDDGLMVIYTLKPEPAAPAAGALVSRGKARKPRL